jgi:hypothetical protein
MRSILPARCEEALLRGRTEEAGPCRHSVLAAKPRVRHRSITHTAILAALGLAAGCSIFSDGAVDLARCIGNGADEMSRNALSTSQVVCSVRANRPVTAILYPSLDLPSESEVTALRQMGVPSDALYHLMGLGPVNVYDGHYTDNRKYSASPSFGSNVRIRKFMAKTADKFTVTLLRQADGGVEVVSLR